MQKKSGVLKKWVGHHASFPPRRSVNIIFRLALAGYISYIFLFCCGWLRKLLSGLGPIFANSGWRKFSEKIRVGYQPLYSSFQIFYTGHVYHHLKPVFCQQIDSCSCAKGPSDKKNITFLPISTLRCRITVLHAY